ncbi:MAG: NUDIX hydrolase [Desulfobacterales bacterium]|nr:NUDIX hydrolase [Desulfobacterales bacterium]
MQNHERDCVYRTSRFDVYETDLVKRSGGVLRRGYIKTANAVVVLPLLIDGGETKIVMIRNKRFAIEKTLWELPAGTLEAGEDIDKAAARECEEETGYKAGNIQRVSGFYSCPGMVTEKLHGYIAENLSFVGQKLDETEQITTEAVTFSESMEMIKSGQIEDAKSIALILYYQAFIHKHADGV